MDTRAVSRDVYFVFLLLLLLLTVPLLYLFRSGVNMRIYRPEKNHVDNTRI